MKVIGEVDRGEIYICQVSHKELEKFMNLYYNKMQRLKVGDEVDLGKGYDFANQTERALKQTSDFIGANKEVIEVILSGITVMSRCVKTATTEIEDGEGSD